MRARFLSLLLLLAAALPAHAKPKEERLDPGTVHGLVTRKHDRAWSLYVPSKYSARSSWPLVISSHGRGGEGAREIRAWQALANKHGFIVACPDMVTATNHRPAKSKLSPSQEDDEVLMDIFAFVCEHFRVNRRAAMITGFSGGGNPSYHSGLRHPEVFTHICTRGGNFAPQQIPAGDASIEAGREHLQIYIFFGERDHVLIIGNTGENGQAHAARDALKNAGYANVKFEKVDGMKHESRPGRAAAWFGEYIAANKKAFKSGDKVDALLEKSREALGEAKHKNAVKYALQARVAEQKHGLRETSAALIDELNRAGTGLLDEAKAAGDPGAKKRLVSSIARDFKGLPVGDDAKALLKELQAEK